MEKREAKVSVPQMCNMTVLPEIIFIMYFFLSCPEVIERKHVNNMVAIQETFEKITMQKVVPMHFISTVHACGVFQV